MAKILAIVILLALWFLSWLDNRKLARQEAEVLARIDALYEERDNLERKLDHEREVKKHWRARIRNLKADVRRLGGRP